MRTRIAGSAGDLWCGFDQGCMQDIAFGAGGDRVERPAGREHEPEALCCGIDARRIETNHGRGIRPITKVLAVATCDIDHVTNGNIPQEAEMRVAMRGIYRNTALARINRLVEMAGSE